MTDDLEQRLAAVAVDVRLQRLARGVGERGDGEPDQRGAHRRWHRPTAPRATDTHRAAAVGIPAVAHVRAGGVAPATDSARVDDWAESQTSEQADLEHT